MMPRTLSNGCVRGSGPVAVMPSFGTVAPASDRHAASAVNFTVAVGCAAGPGRMLHRDVPWDTRSHSPPVSRSSTPTLTPAGAGTDTDAGRPRRRCRARPAVARYLRNVPWLLEPVGDGPRSR